MSSIPASSPSRSSFDNMQTPPALITYLNLPPQLTLLLAELGPYISEIRRFLETVSWKSSYSSSWLLLGIWWGVCLFSGPILRYFLILPAASIYLWLSTVHSNGRNRQPLTEQNIQATVIDLSVIETLIPSLPQPAPIAWPVIGRVVALLYVPTLLLVHYARLRIIVSIVGSVLLAWRAPWFCTIRSVLWRSAWFRYGVSRCWTFLSGESFTYTQISRASLTAPNEPSHSARFLITIYENQRWWVGLDWTAALLPSERASWCSSTQEPLSPPSSFTLPGPSIAYTGDGKGGLVKRTSVWAWDEGEWKVVVKKDQTGLRRIEKELPIPKEDNSAHANRAGRAKQKLHEASTKLKTAREGDHGDVESVNDSDLDTGLDDSCQDVEDGEELSTDSDGWVYGDNKWSAHSSSGGLGKYTRFRRWTRIALLSEIVEAASAEEAQNHQQALFSVKEAEVRERNSEDGKLSVGYQQRQSNDSGEGARESLEREGIRKRLKAAILKSSQ